MIVGMAWFKGVYRRAGSWVEVSPVVSSQTHRSVKGHFHPQIKCVCEHLTAKVTGIQEGCQGTHHTEGTEVSSSQTGKKGNAKWQLRSPKLSPDDGREPALLFASC